MNEKDQNPQPAGGGALGASPDTSLAEDTSRSLTISAKRLAGSPACLNCGTPLEGPFCYYCGQPDKNLMRFFPALAREVMQDFMEFDSRFWRTMKPLLFQPGKLTRDYLDGRRFRYTPPLRLYIFSSMAFFILAAMLAGNSISIHTGTDSTADQDKSIEIGVVPPGYLDKVSQTLEKNNPELAAEFEQAVKEEIGDALVGEVSEDESSGINIHLGDTDEDDDVISFNDKPWDPETNPVVIPFAPDFINEWINDEIEESPQKGKEIEANPNIIVDKIFEVLPATMFILLPVVALLFKFWYLFAKKYYLEHLILALHNHSFLFVILLISMLSNSVAGWLEPAEEGPVTTTVFIINAAILCWLPVYFLLSLKRVYQQGWGLTVGKYLVIGLSYFILLIATASIVALTSFVML